MWLHLDRNQLVRARVSSLKIGRIAALQRKISVSVMASSDEIAVDFPPFLRVYKDGRVERLRGTDIVPPSIDPKTGVSSKDVSILPESGVSARLFLPKLTNPTQKLPILIHYHGGGFLVETPFSPLLHNYLNSLVAEANVIVVSVHYRRAPENPLPTAYDDSWAALQWTASHANGGPESWLRNHGDFTRVFVSGESAGGNIAHHIAMRAGSHELDHGVKIYGAILVHPFFWGTEAIGNEMKYPATQAMMERLWRFVCPSTTGLDDPLINPTAVGAPSLRELGCKRVFVFVAGMDALRDRGWLYHHTLISSGWEGTVEMFETEGEDHVFHVLKPSSEKAVVLMKRLAAFLHH